VNNVDSFGKIIIERKSSEVDIEAHKKKQAQQRVVSIPVRSVNDVMLKLKQIIKTGLSEVIGCCIVSNGKMVFASYSSGEVIVIYQGGCSLFPGNL
jgi:hypothetical protein